MSRSHDRPLLDDSEPGRLSDDDLGGRAALEAAGLEPVDGWDDERHQTRGSSATSNKLLKALERVVAANPAFRVGTIGCPNSGSRARQNEQIAAEDEALAAIAEARGLPGLAPFPVPGT